MQRIVKLLQNVIDGCETAMQMNSETLKHAVNETEFKSQLDRDSFINHMLDVIDLDNERIKDVDTLVAVMEVLIEEDQVRSKKHKEFMSKWDL